MGKLKVKDIKKYYIDKGMTDKDIASIYGVHPVTIRSFRQKHQIKTRDNGYKEILDHVIQQLKGLGVDVQNNYKKNQLSCFYLLLNGKTRVDVKKSSISRNNTYVYTLTDPIRNGMVESDIRIKLPNGRYRKLHRKTCDYIIFCGVQGGKVDHWIIPSRDLPDTLQTVTIPSRYGNSKYNKYRENWKPLL